MDDSTLQTFRDVYHYYYLLLCLRYLPPPLPNRPYPASHCGHVIVLLVVLCISPSRISTSIRDPGPWGREVPNCQARPSGVFVNLEVSQKRDRVALRVPLWY